MKITIFQKNEIPCFNADESHVALLKSAFPEAEVLLTWTEPEFLAQLPDTDIAFTWYWKQAWFDLAAKLRFVSTPAAGRDFFQVVPPASVKIHHGAYHGEFMSETLLGMMLAYNRGILDAHRRQIKGELWPRLSIAQPLSIRRSHAVVLGVGNVAQWCISALKAFDVRITGLCRHPEAARLPSCCDADDRIVSIGELDSVLPCADHLILILPNDTGTDCILNRRTISLLPSHAVVYNIGRGNAVDEEALDEALRAGAIRGACLDVFKDEPLPEASPLARDGENLLRLPHSSAFDLQYMQRAFEEAIVWLKEEL